MTLTTETLAEILFRSRLSRRQGKSACFRAGGRGDALELDTILQTIAGHPDRAKILELAARLEAETPEPEVCPTCGHKIP